MRGGFTPVHPWTHFLSQAGAPVPHLLLGHFLLPVGQGSPSERLQLPLFSLQGIHSGDTQHQCLFGLLHPFLCPALLWLEGHGGFNYFTIRIILSGGGGPWMNHLYFRFQGNWWCFMHLQAWQFLAGCGVRGDLGGLLWEGGGLQLFAPWGSCLFPCQGMQVGLQTPGEGRFLPSPAWAVFPCAFLHLPCMCQAHP